ncbi:MAG TPA: phosphoribosyltransferase, partial [Chloroflexota bacterium]|nr:phosphoribosyltransferase [Chloroflexota bacterium]
MQADRVPLMFGSRRFRDRTAAGVELAGTFAGQDLHGRLVLGLPRGGVIVARSLALSLGLPYDFYTVRKLPAPQSAEYGIGAVAEDGEPWIDGDVVARLGIPPSYLAAEVEGQRLEIKRQIALYRNGRP